MNEMYPGKFESEKKGWYFSCDEGKRVLVGIKSDSSTCPVIGMEKYSMFKDGVYTPEGLRLIEDSTVILGSEDSACIYKTSMKAWKDFCGENLMEEWGNERDAVVFIQTDTEYIIRLHVAFE